MRAARWFFPGLWSLIGATAHAVGAAQAVPPAEVLADWQWQDRVTDGRPDAGVISQVISELGGSGAELRRSLDGLRDATADDPRWMELYLQACAQRRAARLTTLLAKAPRIIFTKHYDLGGSYFGYTEGLSDAQNERHFEPGASLCLLTMDGVYGRVETLLDDRGGVIRDPDVACDASRVLFAWKKSLDDDDYHLYEMDMAARRVRQLTSGLGCADYEGVYAPNGDIIFNSTRCVQTVDCWWTEVSNLYTCDRDGGHLRRLTFDQVHTNYPQITPDGRVIYTRWEYNDRSQMFPQGLFQMFPDGTGQTELYGNNSWFPTSILHARAIPGTRKVVGIFSGHHTSQRGWLGIIDPTRGRQENEGATLIAPVRETPAVREDAYGQDGDQFQYPYPLSATEFVVTFRPAGAPVHFGLYWMAADGRREWLASDPDTSCNQPVPLAVRPRPHVRPSLVDYSQTHGVYYLQDVYAGPGLAGVPRGTIKKLRVVALDFRAAGIGANGSHGEAGGALCCTPVSVGNAAWDPKIVLGEATVCADGSALFSVPARTPVYFQALNGQGYAVQTMRSWSTLQPGERASCVGCHESKNASPPAEARAPLAVQRGVQPLAEFYGPSRGFSFAREIQPILDRHCIRCHHVAPRAGWEDRERERRPTAEPDSGKEAAFSLRGDEVVDAASKRRWSQAYLALTNSRREGIETGERPFFGVSDELVNWISPQSAPPIRPPATVGAIKSRLMAMLEGGHGGVHLAREELEKIACWIDLGVPFCGDYLEANAWNEQEIAKYQHFLDKRHRLKAAEQDVIESMRNKIRPDYNMPVH